MSTDTFGTSDAASEDQNYKILLLDSFLILFILTMSSVEPYSLIIAPSANPSTIITMPREGEVETERKEGRSNRSQMEDIARYNQNQSIEM